MTATASKRKRDRRKYGHVFVKTEQQNHANVYKRESGDKKDRRMSGNALTDGLIFNIEVQGSEDSSSSSASRSATRAMNSELVGLPRAALTVSPK